MTLLPCRRCENQNPKLISATSIVRRDFFGNERQQILHDSRGQHVGRDLSANHLFAAGHVEGIIAAGGSRFPPEHFRWDQRFLDLAALRGQLLFHHETQESGQALVADEPIPMLLILPMFAGVTYP